MDIKIPTSVYGQAVSLPGPALGTLAAMVNGADVPHVIREGSDGHVTILADGIVVKGKRLGNFIRVSQVRAGRKA